LTPATTCSIRHALASFSMKQTMTTIQTDNLNAKAKTPAIGFQAPTLGSRPTWYHYRRETFIAIENALDLGSCHGWRSSRGQEIGALPNGGISTSASLRSAGQVFRSVIVWAPRTLMLGFAACFGVVCVCQVHSAVYPTERHAWTDRPGSVRDLTSSLFALD
jgi:hypothetical protein